MLDVEKNSQSKNCAAQDVESQRALKILREPAPPTQEYIHLSQAAVRLGCTVDDLLGKGIRRELYIYAPVLDEGEYVWPVTDRGIPHSRTIGDGGAPVLRARLQRGDYQILDKPDLERIKVGAEIIPEGYICPSIVLCLLKDLKNQQEMGLIDFLLSEKMAKRIQDRAKDVAWVPSHGMEEDMARRPVVGRVIRADMLCLDSDDFDLECAHLNEGEKNDPVLRRFRKPEQPPLQSDAVHSLDKVESSSLECDSGLMILERQIRAIETGIKKMGFEPMLIPRGGKKKLLYWCLETYPELFRSAAKDEGSKFKGAWKEASVGGKPRLSVVGRAVYAGKK